MIFLVIGVGQKDLWYSGWHEFIWLKCIPIVGQMITRTHSLSHTHTQYSKHPATHTHMHLPPYLRPFCVQLHHNSIMGVRGTTLLSNLLGLLIPLNYSTKKKKKEREKGGPLLLSLRPSVSQNCVEESAAFSLVNWRVTDSSKILTKS